MEEAVQALNEIKELIATNETPSRIPVFTLVFSAISVVFAIFQYMQNTKLQKIIHEREVRMQSRENILQIYNAFCTAQTVVGTGTQNLAKTFSNPEGVSRWLMDLDHAGRLICQATNQVKLFFKESDPDFVEMLEICRNKFTKFQKDIWEYINSGKAQLDYNSAWNIIGPQLGTATTWSTPSLWQNPLLLQKFVQLCDTDEVKHLKKQGNEFLVCLTYDKFDFYFEKHLKFDKLL